MAQVLETKPKNVLRTASPLHSTLLLIQLKTNLIQFEVLEKE